MGKKIVICIIIIIIILIGIAIWLNYKKDNEINELDINYNSINEFNIKNNNASAQFEKEQDNVSLSTEIDQEAKKEVDSVIKININNNILDLELEENSATKSLVEKLQNGDITINAKDYGGFEKIGNLGFELPKEDKNITTSTGDLVLYQGDKLSLFYNSNSWSYTKIGKIKNINSNDLKNILGSGDVTIILSLD